MRVSVRGRVCEVWAVVRVGQWGGGVEGRGERGEGGGVAATG